jgi:hypothetical protein
MGTTGTSAKKGGMTEIEKPFTPDQKSRATELVTEINTAIGDVRDGYSAYIKNFAKLGTLLLEVRDNKYWLLYDSSAGGPFESFGAYLERIKEQTTLGKTQLWKTISVSERLLPYSNEEQITEMGISKAAELAKYIKDTGCKPPQDTIDLAVSEESTVIDVKKALYGDKFQAPENTNYHSIEFYSTDEEWQTLKDAFYIAERVPDPIPENVTEPAKNKEILLRLSMEFISSNAHLVSQ